MNTRNLDFIFKPKRIALIGVTQNPNSVGGKILSNLVSNGFRGVVYPVSEENEAVLGIPCFSSIDKLPRKPDLAIICTASVKVPSIVKSCGEAGIQGIIINSAGFGETGEEGRALENELKEITKNYTGMRILGPNCLGIIAPALNLNASFSTGMPQKGKIAFISQSGALCTSVLDWAIKENIGFSYFVSLGNALDIDFGSLIDYFGRDEGTESIVLYVESIKQARRFMTAARAFARTKPIVAYKAGRFLESAKVAASHTGALASEDGIYDAAFKRAGIVRVFDIGEIFDCTELIGRHKVPKGTRLGIVTNAGGPGVMAVDALIEANGQLATLSKVTLEELNANLPAFWSHGNPVDVLGDAPSKRMAKAVNIVLNDKGVDAVLVILTPQAMTKPSNVAKLICELGESTTKPILAAWLGGVSMTEGVSILTQAGIPTFTTPEQAIRAFMTLVEYSRNIERLYETPKDIRVDLPVDRNKLHLELGNNAGKILSEVNSKEILAAYGINANSTEIARSVTEAKAVAKKIGYPVVLKVYSPDITHKTDVGGVILNIQNEEGLVISYNEIIKNVCEKAKGIAAEGVTVQSMVKLKNSIEMILGIKKDPTFGTVILVGSGGITAELYKDSVIGFPPLNESLAKQMLEKLKIYPLLLGYRNCPQVNMDKLIETLIRLSYLASDCPEIKELDINPLLVSSEDIIAVDARVVVDQVLPAEKTKNYEHLVLKPYPEEYIRKISLNNKAEIVLRPIKPEDEPLWLDMLGSCSKETIYSRFRYFFHWANHQTAVKYCFIDYDREIAIVAETVEDGKRKLVGVGRLVADPDHDTVEYAVLISDKWQNQGLGSKLTDYCMEIAKRWGLKRIVAETTTDNQKMLNVLKKYDFVLVPDNTSSLVEVYKNLDC